MVLLPMVKGVVGGAKARCPINHSGATHSATLENTNGAIFGGAPSPFLVKIACIVAGMVLAGVIQSRLRSEVELSDAQAAISRPTKIIASISLLLWLAAIIAGRLIAYIF